MGELPVARGSAGAFWVAYGSVPLGRLRLRAGWVAYGSVPLGRLRLGAAGSPTAPYWLGRLRLRAVDQRAVVVDGDVWVGREARVGRVERVVVGLRHGRVVSLVDAVLDAAGARTRGQRPGSAGKAELQIVIGPCPRRAHRDEGACHVRAAHRRVVTRVLQSLGAILGEPVPDGEAGQRHRVRAVVDQLDLVAERGRGRPGRGRLVLGGHRRRTTAAPTTSPATGRAALVSRERRGLPGDELPVDVDRDVGVRGGRVAAGREPGHKGRGR